MIMLRCSKNKLILSANIIGTSAFEELGRLFTYKINDGPIIEPCGTQHFLYCFNVSAHSLIFTYCSLPFK